jgi:hypothetical protein
VENAKRRKNVILLLAVAVLFAAASFIASRWGLSANTPTKGSDLEGEAKAVNRGSSPSARIDHVEIDRTQISSSAARGLASTDSAGDAEWRKSQIRNDRGHKLLAEIRAKAKESPAPTPVIIAETQEDRATLIRAGIDDKGFGIADRRAEAAAKAMWSRVPKAVSEPTRSKLQRKIQALKTAEVGFILELREAMRSELLSADLSGQTIRPQGAKGVPGSLTTVVERDGKIVKLVGHYFVDYSNYASVKAAGKNRNQARRAIGEMIESL